MRQAGYEFLVHPAHIDEDTTPLRLLPIELARFLSAEKAREVARVYPDDVVLAADTVVAFGDRALGKPVDVEDARHMLMLLSGTTHIVITGITLICSSRGLEQTRTVMSAVKMRRLRTSQIEQYLAGGQWAGKAGGYGIQDRDPFVTRMSGSLSNIVGMPMEATAELLASVGVVPTRLA